MERRNFLQVLSEKGTDFKKEYDRLYTLFYLQRIPAPNGGNLALKDYVEFNFLQFPFRKTCLTLEDFDSTYKFYFERVPHGFDLNYLLSFCEYTYNFVIWMSLESQLTVYSNRQQSQMYIQQVRNVIDEVGYMPLAQGYITIFIPKEPDAIAVSEIVESDVSYKVLEYNHYTMKGDIARKRETIRTLADQLEPRRGELTAINKTLADNVFFMFNNINIRHNNCAEGDKHYKEAVAKMSQDILENWYDETYQLCLLAFLELDNVERTKKVSELKTLLVK